MTFLADLFDRMDSVEVAAFLFTMLALLLFFAIGEAVHAFIRWRRELPKRTRMADYWSQRAMLERAERQVLRDARMIEAASQRRERQS